MSRKDVVMPILDVNWVGKKSVSDKKMFIENCVDIIVNESGCNDKAVSVFIHEHEAENARNDKPVLFLNWMDVPEKRTPEVKDRIAAGLADEVQKITGVERDWMIMLISDYPPNNIAVGGKCRG